MPEENQTTDDADAAVAPAPAELCVGDEVVVRAKVVATCGDKCDVDVCGVVVEIKCCDCVVVPAVPDAS